MIEWKDFYWGTKKGPFLPRLVSELCRKVGTPEKPNETMDKNDIHFKPLLVMDSSC